VDEERPSGGEAVFTQTEAVPAGYCECLGKGRSAVGWGAVRCIQVQYSGNELGSPSHGNNF